VKWSSGTPKASPGYFSVGLVNGVVAEMTVTEHTALYRFNFSSSDGPFSPVIEVELNDLSRSRSNGAGFVDASTGRLTGNGTFNPSFGLGTYDLYFCVDFSGASVRDTGVWTKNIPDTTATNISVTSATGSAGAFVRFNAPSDNSISARVGVSFISIAQACSNAEKEIPDFDFQKTLSAAVDTWNSKLNVIQVDSTGVDENLLQTFWSGVYRSMVSPQDYTGENPLWSSDLPYYDSYYW
jgi:putative alpha-1,2-mannosidase